jgi:hypothetical protein
LSVRWSSDANREQYNRSHRARKRRVLRDRH